MREEAEPRDDVDAPRVDELEPDDRAIARLEDDEDDRFADDLVEDIDLDDLAAMEGPDA